MDFLFVIGLVFGMVFLVNLLNKAAPKRNGVMSEPLVIEKRACPPHQWFWQEIVDQDGNKQGERICCKVCGPLASQSGRD